MKQYFQSKISAIALDVEQTILQVCKLNGMWFNRSTECLSLVGSTGIGHPDNCNQQIRGVGTGISDYADISAMPS